MSEGNVEVVRRGYEAFNRRDFDEMVADIAPAFEFVPTGALPDAEAIYRGPEGWKRFTEWLSEHFDDARVEVRECLEVEDKVLASVHLFGRGKLSGVETRWSLWHLWTLSDCRVVYGCAFNSRAEALEAAGLTE